MPSHSGPRFHHHHQQDGSWQSVCPVCELPVVTEEREDALAWIESFHFCDPDRLHQLARCGAPPFDLPMRYQRPN